MSSILNHVVRHLTGGTLGRSARVIQQAGGSIERGVGLERIPIPDFGDFPDEPMYRVSLCLLEHSPQTISELERTSNIGSKEIHEFVTSNDAREHLRVSKWIGGDGEVEFEVAAKGERGAKGLARLIGNDFARRSIAESQRLLDEKRGLRVRIP